MNRIVYVITTDIDPRMEEDFNHWYGREHLPRLLKVPGVMEARRGVSLSEEGARYIAIYEHTDEYVQMSAQYREAIETTWTRRIRPHIRNLQRQTFRKIFPLEEREGAERCLRY